MTVLLAGRGVERLAGVGRRSLAVTVAESCDALGDPKVLAEGMGMPGRSCAGSEPDGRDDHGLIALWGSAIGSSHTSPANWSAGFLVVGAVGSICIMVLTCCR